MLKDKYHRRYEDNNNTKPDLFPSLFNSSSSLMHKNIFTGLLKDHPVHPKKKKQTSGSTICIYGQKQN